MAGAVNKPKNGNARSNTTSSNKNGTTSSADSGSTNNGETHHTFKVRYYNDTIRTTVTHTASVVDQWIKDVYTEFADKLKLDELVVGLDIEWARHNKVDDDRIKFVRAGILEVNIVLGKHLHLQPKFGRITFSRWDRDTLKNEQVEYACLDAYASFKLGLYLLPLKNPAAKEFQGVSSRLSAVQGVMQVEYTGPRR
ncbi:hypothetical protein C5167_037991 [Papaver somniferum]|uniref:3'-5' exonuclease domain-containing protein n=1 Tax=Papaver somniferum TaxID=3469 RepID=A0A4Y7IBD8_PAPSO|nr:hypothetical protein C5167_037991 [Papaver somniferum]